MSVTYRAILGQLNKLNLLHRIYIQRAAARNQSYFGQIPLLEYVMKNEACTQKEIADFLQVSPPTIAAAVKRLERNGMLRRDDECVALYNYLQRLTANLETDEFRERSVFSLLDEEKRLHVAMKMQEKEEEDGRD